MIAGSIPGQTRTVPLLIYSLLDAPGGIHASLRLVIASVVIAAVALLAGELLDRYGRGRLTSAGPPL
jgi:molybdate transport system permease protein